jgi:hypothetical protein
MTFFWRADAVSVAANRLRPEAEGAFRTASAPRVDRNIRVLQVADKVVLDLEVALVDGRNEGQPIHVLDHRARRVVNDAAVRRPIAQSHDFGVRPVLRDLDAGVVEFLAAAPIDGRRAGQGAGGIDSHFGADHADLDFRVLLFQKRRELRVRRERRRTRMNHNRFIIRSNGERLVDGQPIGGRIDEPASRHHRGRLRQPGRIPERLDFPFRLIAGTGAAVETVE